MERVSSSQSKLLNKLIKLESSEGIVKVLKQAPTNQLNFFEPIYNENWKPLIKKIDKKIINFNDSTILNLTKFFILLINQGLIINDLESIDFLINKMFNNLLLFGPISQLLIKIKLDIQGTRIETISNKLIPIILNSPDCIPELSRLVRLNALVLFFSISPINSNNVHKIVTLNLINEMVKEGLNGELLALDVLVGISRSSMHANRVASSCSLSTNGIFHKAIESNSDSEFKKRAIPIITTLTHWSIRSFIEMEPEWIFDLNPPSLEIINLWTNLSAGGDKLKNLMIEKRIYFKVADYLGKELIDLSSYLKVKTTISVLKYLTITYPTMENLEEASQVIYKQIEKLLLIEKLVLIPSLFEKLFILLSKIIQSINKFPKRIFKKISKLIDSGLPTTSNSIIECSNLISSAWYKHPSWSESQMIKIFHLINEQDYVDKMVNSAPNLGTICLNLCIDVPSSKDIFFKYLTIAFNELIPNSKEVEFMFFFLDKFLENNQNVSTFCDLVGVNKLLEITPLNPNFGNFKNLLKTISLNNFNHVSEYMNLFLEIPNGSSLLAIHLSQAREESIINILSYLDILEQFILKKDVDKLLQIISSSIISLTLSGNVSNELVELCDILVSAIANRFNKIEFISLLKKLIFTKPISKQNILLNSLLLHRMDNHGILQQILDQFSQYLTNGDIESSFLYLSSIKHICDPQVHINSLVAKNIPGFSPALFIKNFNSLVFEKIIYPHELWKCKEPKLAKELITVISHIIDTFSPASMARISSKIERRGEKIYDENMANMINEMGFPKHRAIMALKKTGGANIDAAIEWLFNNPAPSETDELELAIQMSLDEYGVSSIKTPDHLNILTDNANSLFLDFAEIPGVEISAYKALIRYLESYPDEINIFISSIMSRMNISYPFLRFISLILNHDLFTSKQISQGLESSGIINFLQNSLNNQMNWEDWIIPSLLILSQLSIPRNFKINLNFEPPSVEGLSALLQVSVLAPQYLPLNLFPESKFPGHITYIHSILRSFIETPIILENAMIREIQKTINQNEMPLVVFLKKFAGLVVKDPKIFLKAVKSTIIMKRERRGTWVSLKPLIELKKSNPFTEIHTLFEPWFILCEKYENDQENIPLSLKINQFMQLMTELSISYDEVRQGILLLETPKGSIISFLASINNAGELIRVLLRPTPYDKFLPEEVKIKLIRGLEDIAQQLENPSIDTLDLILEFFKSDGLSDFVSLKQHSLSSSKMIEIFCKKYNILDYLLKKLKSLLEHLEDLKPMFIYKILLIIEQILRIKTSIQFYSNSEFIEQITKEMEQMGITINEILEELSRNGYDAMAEGISNELGLNHIPEYRESIPRSHRHHDRPELMRRRIQDLIHRNPGLPSSNIRERFIQIRNEIDRSSQIFETFEELDKSFPKLNPILGENRKLDSIWIVRLTNLFGVNLFTQKEGSKLILGNQVLEEIAVKYRDEIEILFPPVEPIEQIINLNGIDLEVLNQLPEDLRNNLISEYSSKQRNDEVEEQQQVEQIIPESQMIEQQLLENQQFQVIEQQLLENQQSQVIENQQLLENQQQVEQIELQENQELQEIEQRIEQIQQQQQVEQIELEQNQEFQEIDQIIVQLQENPQQVEQIELEQPQVIEQEQEENQQPQEIENQIDIHPLEPGVFTPEIESFLNSLTPELRSEIFLTSTEEFLSSLPPHFAEEARNSRDTQTRPQEIMSDIRSNLEKFYEFQDTEEKIISKESEEIISIDGLEVLITLGLNIPKQIHPLLSRIFYHLCKHTETRKKIIQLTWERYKSNKEMYSILTHLWGLRKIAEDVMNLIYGEAIGFLGKVDEELLQLLLPLLLMPNYKIPKIEKKNLNSLVKVLLKDTTRKIFQEGISLVKKISINPSNSKTLERKIRSVIMTLSSDSSEEMIKALKLLKEEGGSLEYKMEITQRLNRVTDLLYSITTKFGLNYKNWEVLSNIMNLFVKSETSGEYSEKLLSLMNQVIPSISTFMIMHSPRKRVIKLDSSHSEYDETIINPMYISFILKYREQINDLIKYKPSLLIDEFKLLFNVPHIINFESKRIYFYEKLERLRTNQEIRLAVRRNHILDDSYHQLRRRSSDELKGRIRVTFSNEPGVDAGGVTRDYYHTLAHAMLNPGYALFAPSSKENSTYQPNRFSYINNDHLEYFRFCGVMIAKSILDRVHIDAYFTRSFYKHILQLPVTYKDMEETDNTFYRSLIFILEEKIDEEMGLTFGADYDDLGVQTVVDLVENGRNIPVLDSNKLEFIRLITDLKMTKNIEKQIKAFRDGFHEIIPQKLIQIFGDKELELMISGLPSIDIEDMKENTIYRGYTKTSIQIIWFWEIVSEYSEEDKAQLLQFTTGSSKVPLEGFKELRGLRGIQRFCIQKTVDTDRLPTAHTCFHVLDLPQYDSKEILKVKLLYSIKETQGFGFV